MSNKVVRAGPEGARRLLVAAVRKGEIYLRCPACRRGVLVAMTGARGPFMRCSRRACGYVEPVEE
jgi:hypothetical protein